MKISRNNSYLAQHGVRQPGHDVLGSSVLLLQAVVAQAGLQQGFPAQDQRKGGQTRHGAVALEL